MSNEKRKKRFFHQRFPRLDRFLHLLETPWERQCRHLLLEDPEAYYRMMDRWNDQTARLRESARETGSVGLGG